MRTRILFAAITTFASMPPTYAVTRDPSNHMEFFHKKEGDAHKVQKKLDDTQPQASEEAPPQPVHDRDPLRR